MVKVETKMAEISWWFGNGPDELPRGHILNRTMFISIKISYYNLFAYGKEGYILVSA